MASRISTGKRAGYSRTLTSSEISLMESEKKRHYGKPTHNYGNIFAYRQPPAKDAK